MNGGDCRFAVPPNPGTVRIHVRFTDCGESSGTTGSATSQPPVLLSSVVFGLPKLFLFWGVRQISTDSELLSVVFSSSRALHLHLHRFIIGTDRSPDWFRFLSECLGRTGRHRRTGGNRSVPSLIPTHMLKYLSLCLSLSKQIAQSLIWKNLSASIR